MVSAKAARQPPAKIAAALVQHLTAAPRDRRRPRPPDPASSTSACAPRRFRALLPHHPGRRRGLRRRHHRTSTPDQRGVCLRQPDRPDAYRPLPRRRRRRRPGQPADQGRLRRHQGVLHQRRRRPGHRPRLGRLLALPPGHRLADDRGRCSPRSARRPAIQRRVSDPGGQGAGATATRPPWPPRTSASPRRNSGSTR